MVKLCFFSQNAPVTEAGRGPSSNAGMVQVVVKPVFETDHQDVFWPVEVAHQVPKLFGVFSYGPAAFLDAVLCLPIH